MMNRVVRAWSALVVMTLVAACGTLAPLQTAQVPPVQREAVSRFEMQGRLAVSDGRQAAFITIRWVREDRGDVISFDTPLGQTLAQITIDANEAVLQEANGRRTTAASADALAAQVVGTSIPVSRLADWAQAVAGPAASVRRRDELGRIALIAEQGWLVAYPEYASPLPAAMPRRIEAERGDTSVRLVIDEWRSP